MPSHALLRLLDSFFRHPVLYLLPLVLFALLGAFVVVNQETEYRSDGVVFVEDRTFLSSLTEVRGAEGGYQTPAGYTSGQLNSLLQTDAFLAAVVEQSGLADPATLAPADYEQLRSSLGSWEAGENLMHVWAAHQQPEVAHGLAGATIESLIQWQIDADISQSSAAEGFLNPLTDRYREDLAAARESLEEYLQSHPAPEDGERPASQQLVIDGLTAEVSDANARYTDALGKEESARLATAQAESDVRNRLKVIDEPKVPVSPQGSLRTSAITLALFLMIGTVLSLGAIVAGAVVDPSLRFPSDVERRLGVDVVASLPDASAWTIASPQTEP